MNCPKCNGSTTVAECFKDSDGVYRIRKCLACKHRFATSELVSDSTKFYKLKSAYYGTKIDWE